MADSALYFAVKSVGLSTRNGRKGCDLLTAARHNLREIQAERGADSHIDAKRMGLNVIMAGPQTAQGIKDRAAGLLASVDTSKLKRDHVQAVEAVFSLPGGAQIDAGRYFAACLDWTHKALPLPVLSAVAHHDEAEQHMHVLLLPIENGRHIGGDMLDKPKLGKLRDSFFDKVAGPFGLKRQSAKMRGEVKQRAIGAVLQRCEAMGLPEHMGALWAVFSRSIEVDPVPHFEALGLRFDASQRPIALGARPIALEKNVELSCVALAQNSTSKTPQTPARDSTATTAGGVSLVAQETLASLWAAVGCRSTWKKLHNSTRMATAKQAQQRAIDRHPKPQRPKPQAPAGLDDLDGGIIRIRDEHAHDLSAWVD